MNITTTRFGPVEVESEDVIHFPEGLLGLTGCHDWVLLADSENDALAWMQSVDRASVALAVVSPRRLVPDYQVRVARRELAPLQLDDVTAAHVLVIVGTSQQSVTLNLKAPVVINLERRLGRQVIANGQWPIQYEIPSRAATLRKTA